VRYLDKNQTDFAMNFYNHFESDSVILPEMRHEALTLIKQKELQLFIQNNGFEQSRNKIIEYSGQNIINKSDKNNYLVFVYSKEITRLSNNNDWITAIKTVQQAVQETEKDPRMVKLEENIKYNASVIYHNKFAAFYNKNDKSNALSALEEGLRIVPDSKTLLADLERLKKE